MTINWTQFFLQMSPWGLPLAGSLLLLLIGPFAPRRHRLHFGVAFLTGLASLVLAWQKWMTAAATTTNLLLFDQFTYLFVILFLIAFLLVLLLSYSYLELFGLVRPEYYALLLASVFGMGCMAAGHDLMVVFLGLEIMSVAVYVLAGFQRSNTLCVEASLKYFLVGAFASAFLLLGIAFLYGATGTTDLIAWHEKGAAIFNGTANTYALIGMSLLAVGLFFKIAVVPFHFWVADVYEGAPLIVTTFMATAVKAAGFAALLRVVWALFQWDPILLSQVVAVAAAATMTVGNIAALTQRNLKRMLAYSSIAHAGYALIPLAAFAKLGAPVVSSIGFYLLAYILMTIGAFAVLISATQPGQERCAVKDLAGLGARRPFVAFMMTVFLLSLAGFPPTLGFFGKYYLFLQAMEVGAVWLVVVAVLNSVISVYYYLSPVVSMYFGAEPAAAEKGAFPFATPSHAIFAVIWIAFLGVTLFGLFPSTLLEIFHQTAGSWLVAGK